jgi:hypothetical protein
MWLVFRRHSVIDSYYQIYYRKKKEKKNVKKIKIPICLLGRINECADEEIKLDRDD